MMRQTNIGLRLWLLMLTLLVVAGVTAAIEGGTQPPPAVAQDVDGDGDMEIAVENYNNKVFLLDVTSLLFYILPFYYL